MISAFHGTCRYCGSTDESRNPFPLNPPAHAPAEQATAVALLREVRFYIRHFHRSGWDERNLLARIDEFLKERRG